MRREAAPALASLPRAPGPRGLPLLGVVPRLAKDPLAFLEDVSGAFGDVVRFRVGRAETLLVNSPEAARDVLMARSETFDLSPTYERLEPAIGGGLTVSRGAAWRRRRAVAQKTLSPTAIEPSLALFHDEAARLGDTWSEARGAQDVAHAMFDLTIANIFRAIFGASAGAAPWVIEDFATLSREIGKRLFSPTRLLERLPTAGNRRFAAAKARLDGEIAALGRGASATGLRAMMERAGGADGTPAFDEAEIRDEIMTFALAGHETTAATLTWLFVALSTYPEVADRVRAECAAFWARPGGLTLARLSELVYTRAVLNEVMRLYAPAWILSRQASTDTELGGFRCDRGTIVFVSPYLLHRHPRHWREATAFDPERFLDGAKAARAPLAYMPFGLGARACVGSQFAVAEALVTIATLAPRFRFSGKVLSEVALEPAVILRPRGEVRLTMEETR